MSIIGRIKDATPIEEYMIYLLLRGKMLVIKERDNTMSSIPIMVDVLEEEIERVQNGEECRMTIESLDKVSIELVFIGRRHGMSDTLRYSDFIAVRRDKRLDDLGI